MDNTLWLGIILIIAGIVFFLLEKNRPKKPDVGATDGSVAIGGNNTGNINNLNVRRESAPKHGAGGHNTLTLIAIVVELVGIAVVIWHAFHLAK